MKFQHVGRMAIHSLVVMAMGVVSAAAQHEEHQMPGSGSPAPEKVASCAQGSQAVTETLDAANARIEEARQTNNAAAMRSAIGDLQVAVARMKQQLADCVSLGAGPMAPGMPGMDHSKMPMPSNNPPAPQPGSAAPSSKSSVMDIALKSQPTPPKAGENQFEVTVKAADGSPIADADVSVLFVMPAMPAMRMPEMRTSVKLIPAGNGIYRGNGNLGMAGEWDVTITVSRKGETLGVKKQKMAAQ